MGLRMHNEVGLQQRQLLLPQILQGVEMLQLPRQELTSWLREEAAVNEALVLDEDPVVGSEENPTEIAGVDLMESDYPGRLARGSDASGLGPVDRAVAPVGTLADDLREQIAFLEVSPGARGAFECLLGALDPRGHLPVPSIAIAIPLTAGFPIQAAEEAYAILRGLEPMGVGASGPVECMLDQLDSTEPDMEQLVEILTLHLEALAKGRRKSVARAMGIEMERLESLLVRIAKLDPCPGYRFSGEGAMTIIPDLVLQHRPEGGFDLLVEEGGLPGTSLSPTFLDRAKQKDLSPSQRTWMQEQIKQARSVISSLAERSQTLYRVALEAVERQAAFFTRGESALIPLRMDEVASYLELHPSTISRTVAGKWLQCDTGIIPLRLLFTGKAVVGGMHSHQALREKIGDLIRNEDPGQTLTDSDLVKCLGKTGIEIARRTVAKYRSELGLASSRERGANPGK